MKKRIAFLLMGALVFGLLGCAPKNPEHSSDTEDADNEPDIPGFSSEADTTAYEPTPPSQKTDESTTDVPTETITPTRGETANNGVFTNVDALPNKSIPYGNDWEDKDATGLPQGIHYYESMYGKYYPVYRINTAEKRIYLTFDEGYEAGYTPKILDTLKAKGAKAVFFLTKQFVDSDPELVQRMIREGHVLGNHTCLHPEGGYPKYVDEHGLQSFTDDVEKLHSIVLTNFGYDMKLFRFPEGESSERTMAQLSNMGYTPVFWSYAHYDYNQSKQPEVSVTLDRCLSHMAPGAVYLLHAVSSSNTEALGAFIDGARAQGYDFGVFPVEEVSKR